MDKINLFESNNSRNTNLGNRNDIPLSGATIPTPALWTGDNDRSAHLSSHTTAADNHTSGS